MARPPCHPPLVPSASSEVGQEPAGGEFLGDVAGPAPLVFEFVRDVLPAPSGAALRAKAPPFGYLAPLGSASARSRSSRALARGGVGALVQRSDEDGDSAAPWGGAGRPVGAAGEGGLQVVAPPPGVRAHGGEGGGFAHEDDATFTAPAAQPQGGFVAIAAVAAQEGQPVGARQRVEPLPKSGQAVLGRVVFAAADFHPQAHPRVGHKVAGVAMARASGLLRIVAELRALLVAVERLDGAVDVQDPWHAEHRLNARPQLPGQPRQPGALGDAFHRAAHHVLAHRARHAQQRWVQRIAAHRADVGVAPNARRSAGTARRRSTAPRG